MGVKESSWREDLYMEKEVTKKSPRQPFRPRGIILVEKRNFTSRKSEGRLKNTWYK